MNNPIIETDLKEYLQEFKQGFYQINQKWLSRTYGDKFYLFK
jgi:hypothetical protein